MTKNSSAEQRKNERVSAPEIGPVEVFSDLDNRKFSSSIRLGTSFVENTSEDGVAIRMNKPVPIGDILYLRSREVRSKVRVCHCSRSGIDFRLGLEFLSDDSETEIRKATATQVLLRLEALQCDMV